MLMRLLAGLTRRARFQWYRFRGVNFRGSAWIQSIEIPRNHFDIELADQVSLDRGVTLIATGQRSDTPRIRIGKSTYINRFSIIDASESIVIGQDCMIGPFVYVTDHDHGTQLGLPIAEQPLVSVPVEIGDGVWIGAHVTILKGVRVGKGAVLAAGSVVTKNIGENEIFAGVPAKRVRHRGELP